MGRFMKNIATPKRITPGIICKMRDGKQNLLHKT
jgi:hypothetical protein